MTKTSSSTAADKVFYLYILMRNDLASLNPGKACAQAAHASNQLVAEAEQSVVSYVHVTAWAAETGKGFGTTIVLETDIGQIEKVVREMSRLDEVQTGIVHDPTYPIRDGNVTHLIPLDTCGYVFGERSTVQWWLKNYSLMA